MPPADLAEERRATPAEEEIWLSCLQLGPSDTSYNLVADMRFTVAAPVDGSILETEVRTLHETFPGWRSRFEVVDSELWMAPDGPVPEVRRCVLPDDPDAAEATIAAVVEDARTTPLSLDGPLVRMTVCVPAGPTTTLALVGVCHHLVSDVHSARVIEAHLAAHVARIAAGGDPTDDPPAEVAPGAATRARPRRARSGLAAEAERYWSDMAAGRALALPTDLSPAATDGWPARTLVRAVPDATWRALVDLCATGLCTEFDVLVAAGAALLVRYGNPDPLIGVSVSTRRSGDRAAVGCYVRLMPIRVPCGPGTTGVELVDAARTALRRAYLYRHTPARRPGAPGAARPPIQVAMTYVSGSTDLPPVDLVTTESAPHPPSQVALPVALNFVAGDDGAELRLDHSAAHLTPAAAERLADHVLRSLEHVAVRPAKAIDALDLTTEDEAALLARFESGGRRPPPRG